MGKRKRKSANSDDEISRKIRRLERRRDKNRYWSESEYSDDHRKYVIYFVLPMSLLILIPR